MQNATFKILIHIGISKKKLKSVKFVKTAGVKSKVTTPISPYSDLQYKIRSRSIEKHRNAKYNKNLETQKLEEFHQSINEKIQNMDLKSRVFPFNRLLIVKSKHDLISLKSTLTSEENSLKKQDQSENLNRTIITEKQIRDQLLDKHMAKINLADSFKLKRQFHDHLLQIKRKAQV